MFNSISRVFSSKFLSILMIFVLMQSVFPSIPVNAQDLSYPTSFVNEKPLAYYETLVTRGELAEMVIKAFNIETPETVDQSVFIDVDSKSNDAQYTNTAYEKGLIRGYKLFDKLTPIERMLWPYFEGDDVAVLQVVLKNYGFFKGESKGIYDINTQAAVLRYQKSLGWKGSGNLGTYTKSRVNQLINKMSNEYRNSDSRIMFYGHYTNYAEALKIILEATDVEFNTSISGDSHWYDKYVDYAKKNNIVDELPEMSTKITRSEAEEIIQKVAEANGIVATKPINESPTGNTGELQDIELAFTDNADQESIILVLEKIQAIEDTGQSENVVNLINDYKGSLEDSNLDKTESLDAINNAIKTDFENSINSSLTQEEKSIINFVEPNYLISVQANPVNDTDYSKQWPIAKTNIIDS